MNNPVRPTISVVVCAYTEDRWDQLAAAVASASEQSRPPLEIIVVIDHNTALLEKAREQLSGAIVVANAESRGLSGARNTGVAVAEGDVVAFLDDDAVASPGWLERLSSRYENPDVIAVGGAIDPDWTGARPTWFPQEFDWVVGCTYVGMPEQAAPVRNLIGANMSFRRERLIELGGFVSGMGRIGTFPAGCEETELCIRGQQRWSDSILLYEPMARVKHQVPATRATLSYFLSRCYAEGLSKARVSQLVGSQDGLESERAYTLRTLPLGVARGIRDLVVKRDVSGLGRTVAILAGLSWTTAGYVMGALSSWDGARAASGSTSADVLETRVVGDRIA